MIVIVNPNNRNPAPQSALEPPIWCAYIAQYLHFEGTEILDAEAEGLSIDETVERIAGKPALLVAMGVNPSASSTPKMAVIDELAKRLDKYVLAGLHPQAMQDKKLLPILHPRLLCNFTPAWDLLDFSKYRAHNWHCLHDLDKREGYGVVYTSFGCPFNCSYCNIHAIYGTRQVYFRDPVDAVDEIGNLVETHSVRNLKVCDELFVLNHSHVDKICDLLIERDYGLNIWAYARVDTVHEALLEKMKKAGFNWLCYGFEGTALAGDKYSKDMPRKAVDMTQQAGINVMGNFMFGLPADNLVSMNHTFETAKWLQCEWVNFYCTMAYPGSKLYEDCRAEDLPDNWQDYDQFSLTAKPLRTADLTPQEILEFRDRAFIEYFSDKTYQRMIQMKFGKPAVNHIKEMLKWKPLREMPSSMPSSK